MPHELTKEEIQEAVLTHIRAMAHYWDRQPLPSDEKLDGLAFSILVMLDGRASLPAFAVVPLPDPSDKAYHIENDENWYPDGCDIAGDLHDKYYQR